MREDIGLRIRDLGWAPGSPLCVQVLRSVVISYFDIKVSRPTMKVDNRGGVTMGG